MQQQTSVWRYFDVWIITAVIILTLYGILIISSAITNVPAYVGYERRQLIWMTLGLISFFIMAAIDYRILTSAHWFIYAGLVGLLVLVLVIDVQRNNVTGWIPIGSFAFHPAELLRILLPVTLGKFIADRQREMHKFSTVVSSLIYIGIPIALLFLQPDLGMSILIIVIWFGVIMVAGLRLQHFLILIVLGVGLIAVAYPRLQPYQKARITTFVDPESDIEQSRNVTQAVISIGSGGWFGKGYRNGPQAQLGYLRVQHTDFIFAVLSEEMGFFFGSFVVVALIGFIILRTLRVASITPDPAGRNLCIGIATLLFFQTLVSVGMNVQLLPVTGLTFPFVSYGGSSLLTLYLGLGIVQSVLMRHRKQAFG
ncbi:MAG TPA: rod shape-determining protein RodA [Anaerolineae bacterium]|nr:rod shape-determining protein RodA [Anaerolineae bacterium]